MVDQLLADYDALVVALFIYFVTVLHSALGLAGILDLAAVVLVVPDVGAATVAGLVDALFEFFIHLLLHLVESFVLKTHGFLELFDFFLQAVVYFFKF